MQFPNINIQNIAFSILGLLGIIILISSFNIKTNIMNSVFGVKNINVMEDNYENNRQYANVKEGFTGKEGFIFNTDNTVKDDDIDVCITRKIKALKSELGDQQGIDNIKQIMTNAKKVCNYEASKCMMNLLSSNKSTTSINLENLLNDPDNNECKRCKDYTELSDKLKQLIDNL